MWRAYRLGAVEFNVFSSFIYVCALSAFNRDCGQKESTKHKWNKRKMSKKWKNNGKECLCVLGQKWLLWLVKCVQQKIEQLNGEIREEAFWLCVCVF